MQVEFLNRIERQERCGSPGNADLVERGVVEERIVVVRAVERVVIRAVAIAVDVELAGAFFRTGNAGAFDGDAGRERHELAEIATVERELLDEFAVNDLRQCGTGGFHQGNIFGNDHLFHFFRRLRELEIDHGSFTDIHDNVRSAHFLETRRERCNFILTGRQLEEEVDALGIRTDFARLAGAEIACGDFGTGNRQGVSIGNGAADRATEGLRERDRRGDHQNTHDSERCKCDSPRKLNDWGIQQFFLNCTHGSFF